MNKKAILKIYVICTMLLLFNGASAQHESLYKYETFVNNQSSINYRIMYPENFDVKKMYPVVLFLHGAGERGDNNTKQLVHGSQLFASKQNRKNFPAIVIFPQCPLNDFWSIAEVDRSKRPYTFTFDDNAKPKNSLKSVMALMDKITQKPYVDTSRLYVGGLSMGGMGTFEILYRRPKMFAAAFSICGAGNIDTAKIYAKTTPLWVFHGAKDDVVAPINSINMVASIIKHGGNPNFTIYGNDNHNSWDSAFAETDLLPWLFSHHKDDVDK